MKNREWLKYEYDKTMERLKWLVEHPDHPDATVRAGKVSQLCRRASQLERELGL